MAQWNLVCNYSGSQLHRIQTICRGTAMLCPIVYCFHSRTAIVGSKSEAVEIKQKIATFLRDSLKLELSEEKTLVTHARDEAAKFLGYEIHILHADDKHDHRGHLKLRKNFSISICTTKRSAECGIYFRRTWWYRTAAN